MNLKILVSTLLAASVMILNLDDPSMTIHPAPYPVIASVPLGDAEAALKELVFFALVNRGFWLARRGMLTVSIPTTDAMCDELVAAFADVVSTYL